MTRFEHVLQMASMRTETGPDAGAFVVARDMALEVGWMLETITDEEAEYDRVRNATGKGEHVVMCIDRCPRPPRPVRCGGLHATEPNVGGQLKEWIHARVARLWSRRPQLFRYVSAIDVQQRLERDAGYTGLRRKRRWETRDYVELGEKLSAPWQSGFAPGDGPKGKTTMRNVRAPRKTPPIAVPLVGLNKTFDF